MLEGVVFGVFYVDGGVVVVDDLEGVVVYEADVVFVGSWL